MRTKHGTASVFVFTRLAAGWRVGLIHHPRYRRMMLPGGHIERDESAAEAALREVAEEAGLQVGLVKPPAAALPPRYWSRRADPPWWVTEYDVPPDNHLDEPHVHVDHLFVAIASGSVGGTPAHPFGWHTAADLAGLHMFDDTRTLATSLLSDLDGSEPGQDPIARLRSAG